jgi:hypothetical protein
MSSHPKSVIDAYLSASGRVAVEMDPSIEWVVSKTLEYHSIPNELDLRIVTSADAKVSVVTIGDQSCLIWDTAYEALLDELQSAIISSGKFDSLMLTEQAILHYAISILKQRGKHREAEALTKGYQPQTWNRGSGLPATFVKFFKLSEDERLFARAYREFLFDKKATDGFMRSINRFMVFFTVSHEIGHWVFGRRSDIFDAYRQKAAWVIKSCPLAADEASAILPAGTSFEKDENGKWKESTDLPLFLSLVFRNVYREKLISNPEPLEEVCADLFAIDALASTVMSTKLDFMLAHVKLALWLGHQYIKWLSYLRFDLLSHFGFPEDKAENDLLEKGMRGAVKMAYIENLISRQAEDSRLQIESCEKSINWLKYLFMSRQNDVFHRIAHNPELLTQCF